MYQGQCIGYGGLVHIAWADRNGEISFLLETSRNSNIALFQHEWATYLNLLQLIAFDDLRFEKIYTYAYDIRPHLIETLEQQGFVQEARLKRHVFIDDKATDVLIHALFREFYQVKLLRLRPASIQDDKLVYEWLNDRLVRQMSFSSEPIDWETHKQWFDNYLNNTKQYYLIVEIEQMQQYYPCGQVRFDENGEIGILIAPTYRGMGLASICLKLSIDYIRQENNSYKQIIAHIKHANKSSIKAFERAGFVSNGFDIIKNQDCLKYVYYI